jgi:ABC-type transport system substrate-binding protein
MKRALSAVLMLLFFVAGCAATGQKPEPATSMFTQNDTREFFGGTVKFERQGNAGKIMDNAEAFQKVVLKEAAKASNDPNFMEKATYNFYVVADPKGDHVITELNASATWNSYLKTYDAYIRSSVKTKFSQ